MTRRDVRPRRGWPLHLSLGLSLGLPLVMIVLLSVASQWTPPRLWPTGFSGRVWRELLSDPDLLQAVLTSTGIALAVTALTALLALPTAWAISRCEPRVRRRLELAVLLPSFVPGVVVAAGAGQVLLALGLAYSLTGVALVQTLGTFPVMTRLLTARFETLSDELVQAARCLGAGPGAVMRHIVLPLAWRPLAAGALLAFVGSFDEFDKSFVVGAPVIQTLPILLYRYLDPYSMEIPQAAAVALILLMPVLAGVAVHEWVGRRGRPLDALPDRL